MNDTFILTFVRKFMLSGNFCYVFLNENNERIELVWNRKFEAFIGRSSVSLDHTEVFQLANDSDLSYFIFNNDIDEEHSFAFAKAEVELTNENYLMAHFKNGLKEYVHRMVVFCFGDKNGNKQPPFKEKYTEIDHIDGNKLRNIPENLEVVDPIINKYRAFKNHYQGSFKRLIDHLGDSEDDFENVILTLANEIRNEKEK